MHTLFPLPDCTADTRKDTARWLILAVTALALSGFAPLILILARAAQDTDTVPFSEYFEVALVIHVDLSVLVWLLAIAGMLWSLTGRTRWPMTGRAAFWCFAAGTACLTLSPFTGEATPLIVNYIPVLKNPVFFLGLALLHTGLWLKLLTLVTKHDDFLSLTGQSAQRFGIHSAALITVITLIAFLLSYLLLPEYLADEALYETLFWGGGHLLQFTHVQLLVVSWLVLATAIGVPLTLSPVLVVLLFSFNVLAVLVGLWPYAVHPIDDSAFIDFFTQHMRYLGGIVSIVVGVAILIAMVRSSKATQPGPEKSALLASLLLFAVGGLIGYRIHGMDVTVPAHYHGSIVGVTLAFMGLVYHLLPRLGFGEVSGALARFQPWIYGIGQLLHIIGLMWMGGYGVARKTPTTEGVSQAPDLAVELFRLGGLLAVIGGVLFIWLCARAIRRK